MRLIWRALGFLAVMVFVLVGTIFLLPADRLGKILSDQLTKQTGRSVALGETRVTVWPVVGLAVSDLRIGNADWAGDAPLFAADRAAFGLDPVSLIRGSFAFRSIEADGPDLNLVRSADGRVNWSFGSGETGGETGGNTPAVSLNRLAITGGKVTYSDAGKTTRISDADISMDWPTRNGPVNITARVTPAGAPLSITARIEKPNALIGGAASRVAVSVSSAGGTVDFAGLAGIAPEAQGDLTLDLGNTPAMLAALGLGPIDLPEGAGRKLSGKMQITYTRDQILALRDASLVIDGNALAIAADISLAGKPRINARVNATTLDLSALSQGGESTASSGWSKAPIDASALGAIDGELAFLADAVLLGEHSFGKTRALITIDDSRAVFDLRELRAYDGLATGQVVVNNRSGLSARADLAFAEVKLSPLLKASMGVDRLSGPADGSLNVLTSGQSLHEMVAQIDGGAVFRAGPGRIEGIDLDKVLTGNVTGGTTVFDQAVATLDIANGTIRTNDLLLTLPRLQASAEGRVDLLPKILDMLVAVLAPDARGGRGVSVPVRIKGPWSSPQIRVDAAEAINRNLAEERAAVEAKTRAKVNEAIQEKLGVTVQDGESIGDSLKKELEDRAAKGLLDLLNK